MPRFLCVAVVLTMAVTTAFAQETAPEPTPPANPTESPELTCPLDNHKFKLTLPVQGDARGGEDSDQCPHDVRGQSLALAVVVCPRCNFATQTRMWMAMRFTPEQRTKLLRVLARSPWRGVADAVTDIPMDKRFDLAATCAEPLGEPMFQADFLKLAAWSVRVEACRPATLAYASPGVVITQTLERLGGYMVSTPISDILAQIRREIASATTPADKNRLKLYLAMMQHRAGFVTEREKTLVELAAAAAADPAFAERVNRFKEQLALEATYQTAMVPLLQKNLPDDKNEARRAQYTYVLADTLRRLGKDKEALPLFREARSAKTLRQDLRERTDYFLTLLAPGEPLTLPVPEVPVVPEAPKP